MCIDRIELLPTGHIQIRCIVSDESGEHYHRFSIPPGDEQTLDTVFSLSFSDVVSVVNVASDQTETPVLEKDAFLSPDIVLAKVKETAFTAEKIALYEEAQAAIHALQQN